MLKNNKTKNEYVTTKELEKLLSQQTKTILEAVDFSLNKSRKETKAQFDSADKRFDVVNIRFNKLDTRIDKLEEDLKADINNVQTLIDDYVKAQEDFKQEFVIMKEEMKQMKLIFKEKLGVEIRAF